MVLYDVVKQSVHDRAYRHYARGPGASPPPSVRGQYGQPGPLPAVPVCRRAAPSVSSTRALP